MCISGAELYSMYVGDGEALLRNTFQRARLAAPSIIFFDEADVVAGKRLVCHNSLFLIMYYRSIMQRKFHDTLSLKM